MIPLRQELRSTITRYVVDREVHHEYRLPHIDREFLIETLTDLVFQSADKFVLGGKEHNDDHDGSFVMDVNHDQELDNEVIDFIMYSRAKRFRARSPLVK